MSLSGSCRCRRGWWMLVPVVAWLLLAAVPGKARADSSCYVEGVLNMNFGAVTSSGGTATSSVRVVCSPDYSYPSKVRYYRLCMYLGAGSQSAGSVTPRRMSDYNGSYLEYGLYYDGSHVEPIGPEGSASAPAYDLVVEQGSAWQTLDIPVHGQVYPGQSVAASSNYQEAGIIGTVEYRYDTSALPSSCSSGGVDGASFTFGPSVVDASFENSCEIQASPLDFGAVDSLAQPVTGNATLRIQCPAGTEWKVGLDNGQHAEAGLRRMSGSGGYVAYQLYHDASLTQAWGNIEGEMSEGHTDDAGNAYTLTVYGQVPAQPDAQAGSYTDTVIATLYY